jgi:hypothetical protein
MSSDEDHTSHGRLFFGDAQAQTECHVCGSTSTVMNAEGSMVCEDCGVVRVATQEVLEDQEKYMNQVTRC